MYRSTKVDKMIQRVWANQTLRWSSWERAMDETLFKNSKAEYLHFNFLFTGLDMLQGIHQWLRKKVSMEAIQLLKQQVNVELARKNFSAAEETLLRIITLDAHEEDALITLSKVLRQQRKLEEGYRVLQQAIDLNTEHSRQVLAFVQAYEAMGKFDKIEEMLLATIQKAPYMLELRLYLAQHFFERTRLRETEEQLSAILEQDPEHLQAHIGLAHCHIQAGSKAEALEKVKQIRQWDEKQAEILISAIYENVQNFN